MNRYGAQDVSLFVYTFRHGLLSSVGHDLKLQATQLDVLVDEAAKKVRAVFDARSLRVVCAMRGHAEAPELLKPSEREEIEQVLQKEILDTESYPTIEFASDTIEPDSVSGRLTLHGLTRELSFPWRKEGDARVAEVWVDQRDFGIKPYSALMGTLKLKAEVRVEARLPLPR